MPAWSSGQSIAGRYRLEKPLGRGGSAEAWSANDTVDDTRVLIKLPHGGDGRASQAFDREFDASRSLDHPGVARALAHGTDGDSAYLVTTCVEGHSLADRRGQPFEKLAPLFLSVARTLAFVHERGWVHRDVKAANVLVSGERRALLTDFGLAARIGERQAPNGGSPFTRSPAQQLGLPATPADDLYSFGALLYELLSGHPPFFPDRAAAEAPGRRVPRLQAAHPVPFVMESLVERLLEPEPEARPQSMREVADVLEVYMNETQPAGGPEPEAAVRVRWQADATATASGSAAPRRWWPWVAGSAIAVAAFVVFVVLPDHAPVPVLTPTAARSPAIASAPAAAPAAVDANAVAAREAAQRAQTTFNDRIAAIEKRGAAAWSGPDLANARSTAQEGERLLKSEQFADALAAYVKAGNLLSAVEAAAPAALQRALDRGSKALNDAKSGEAIQAFQLALAIDPKNAAAQRGMKRAAVADRVQELIVQGRRAASDKQWAAAGDAFRHALSLDGEAAEARAGLGDAERLLNEELYESAMAQGLTALNQRRFAAARAAIDRAEKLRPAAPEPKDLAARVTAAIAGTQIDELRTEAVAHEKAERWNEALAVYNAIIERNGTLAFARAGRDRVTPRVTLDGLLSDFIARPERLGSPEVRDASKRALAEADSIAPQGPVLAAQATKLKTLLATAATPVRVSIESDAATQVVIFRVGALGSFTRREVDLPPGTYTVLGTRNGFRDVRHELKVRPGESPAALVVRCEDRI